MIPWTGGTIDMPGPRLLLIDDDVHYCSDLSLVLGNSFLVEMVHDGLAALEHLKTSTPDIILLDVNLGEGQMSGLEILEHIRALEGAPPVIMLSGNQDLEMVVQAIKIGAFHYAAKPADLPQLLNLVDKALSSRNSSLVIQAHRDEVERLTGSFVAGDDATLRLLEDIDRVAETDATVLITGESGSGKEMVARRIHERSLVSAGPFVGVNCGAVPAEIIESEMFGHARGTFTGADKLRIGKFEMASGGTLFLDEIGDSPIPFQVKLLRALGERNFSRLGENASIEVKSRILAATSKDLEAAITTGEFRSELFYRLNIYRIHLLPLRDRPGDILPLAQSFLKDAASRYRKEIQGFSPAVQQQMLRHNWPGNVRQLGNEVERAVLTCRGPLIGLGDIFPSGAVVAAAADSHESYDEGKNRVIRQWQLDFFRERLAASQGNVTDAAKASGMPRPSFQRIMKELALDPEDFRN
jgi:DNA-binding NtrC family response regulator